MTTNQPESLVSVYSTPVEFDAGMVKAMLAEEEIPSSIENANGPFPGLAAIPCEVLVPAQYEERARELVAEHEAHLRQRAEEGDDGEAEEDELEEV